MSLEQMTNQRVIPTFKDEQVAVSAPARFAQRIQLPNRAHAAETPSQQIA
jgi:hypothetical protein